jgi:hypothetical protein
MGMRAEIERESVYETEKGMEYEDQKDFLSQFSNQELLNRAIKIGPELGFEGFPAYDIAKRCKESGREMTEKQRKAMINSIAYHEIFKED